MALLASGMGCLGAGEKGIEDKIRELPPLRPYFDQYPEAEVVIGLWDEATVFSVKDEMNAECGKAMPIKAYYRVQFRGDNVRVAFYLDAESFNLECQVGDALIEYVETKQPKPGKQPSEEGKYIPEEPKKLTTWVELISEDKTVLANKFVRIEERIYCDEGQECNPKILFEGKTDLLGRVAELDPKILSNSNIYVLGYQMVHSGMLKFEQGGYRAILYKIISEEDLLPVSVQIFEAKTGKSIDNLEIEIYIGEDEYPIPKTTNEKGKIELTKQDFDTAETTLIDETGLPSFGKIIVKVRDFEEQGEITASDKKFKANSRQLEVVGRQVIESTNVWDLKRKDVIILKLNKEILIKSTDNKFVHDLIEGNNYFSIPVQLPENYFAADFLKMLNNNGIACGSIKKFSRGTEIIYEKDGGLHSNNFILQNGYGYVVNCAGSGLLTMVGEPVTGPLNLTLFPGFNYMGTTKGMDGRELHEMVLGCVPRSYSIFMANDQRGLIPTETIVAMGSAYMLDCEHPGNWNYK